jgi:hypothetical protein
MTLLSAIPAASAGTVAYFVGVALAALVVVPPDPGAVDISNIFANIWRLMLVAAHDKGYLIAAAGAGVACFVATGDRSARSAAVAFLELVPLVAVGLGVMALAGAAPDFGPITLAILAGSLIAGLLVGAYGARRYGPAWLERALPVPVRFVLGVAAGVASQVVLVIAFGALMAACVIAFMIFAAIEVLKIIFGRRPRTRTYALATSGSDVYDERHQRVGYLDGNNVHDAEHRRVGYIDGLEIKALNHAKLGYVEGVDIRDVSHTKVGYMDGMQIRSSSHRALGHLTGPHQQAAGGAALFLLLGGGQS